MEPITYEIKEPAIIAYLQGSLSISNIRQAEIILHEIVNKKPALLAMDFSSLYFIDSSAIATLVNILRGAMNQKTELVFFDLTPEIEVTFRLLNLYNFFKIISRQQFEKEYSSLL